MSEAKGTLLVFVILYFDNGDVIGSRKEVEEEKGKRDLAAFLKRWDPPGSGEPGGDAGGHPPQARISWDISTSEITELYYAKKDTARLRMESPTDSSCEQRNSRTAENKEKAITGHMVYSGGNTDKCSWLRKKGKQLRSLDFCLCTCYDSEN